MPDLPRKHAAHYPALEKRVEIGAKHLDKIQPGWFTKVNMDTLNQTDPFYWVAAQVAGQSYSQAIDRLMLHTPGPISGGFAASTLDYDLSWWQLTRLWKEAIKKRLAQQAVGTRKYSSTIVYGTEPD